MLQHHLAEFAAGNPVLFNAILRFNGILDRPPVPDFLAAPSLASLRDSAAVRALHAGPRKGPGFWRFADAPCRLALLPAEETRRLERTVGAALHAGEIAAIVTGKELRSLREDIGRELADYAACRGRYQLGSVTALFADLDPGLPLAERVLKHGTDAVEAVRSGWPAELRARLGLPPDPAVDPSLTEPGARRAIWFAVRKILLKEVAPQWAPCFN